MHGARVAMRLIRSELPFLYERSAPRVFEGRVITIARRVLLGLRWRSRVKFTSAHILIMVLLVAIERSPVPWH